jgi:uncharacterized protein (DUF1499 family)
LKYLWIVGLACVGLLAAGLVLDRTGLSLGPWGGLARLIGRVRDLGPVSFPTLVRRTTPNDALACPADLCRAAKPDLEAPIFPVPASELCGRLEALVRGEPRTSHLPGAGNDQRRARLVQRSALLRFPDVIDVEIIALDPTRSTLALYSRSVIGISDLGVNRARLARWLDALVRAS